MKQVNKNKTINKMLGMKIFVSIVFLVQSLFAVTITVTDKSDSGANTLRQAITDAVDGDNIVFNLSAGNEIITIASALPSIASKGIIIDGDNSAGSGTNITIQVTTPGVSNFLVAGLVERQPTCSPTVPDAGWTPLCTGCCWASCWAVPFRCC